MYVHTIYKCPISSMALQGRFFFSCNSEAIRSMSLLMENPGDFVDGLVCVCHRDPFSFGEGQSHCGQDCNNHCDRLDRGGGVYL